ncbi:hypothetical protein Godav_027880, partial [Gossypium davidsonii]|nr:hypothetical protein [Gossypium davidsonii]
MSLIVIFVNTPGQMKVSMVDQKVEKYE